MQSRRFLRPLWRSLTIRSFPRPSATSSPLRPFQQNRPFSPTCFRKNNWPRSPHETRNYNIDPRYRLSQAKPLITTDRLRRVARSPSTHTIVVLSIAAAVAFYFSNIQTVPVSGRRRFNCFSEESVEAASEAQVKRLIWEVERSGGRFLSDWDPRVAMVKRVMRKLIAASGTENYDWQIWVIDDPRSVNAFVLPGGKVFVFSGLIPIARNEHGLATVLGHEIAHNLAQHTAERMSGDIGINIFLYSLIFLTGGLAILGTHFIGSTVLDLLFSRPMGRVQESEADYIGLMMMAEACYDPREAVRFWKRMERAQQEEPPEWLSTHPSSSNRIQKIEEWLPTALERRQQSDCKGTSTFADMFKGAMRQGTVIEQRVY
ncbi:peptidase family M48-domain-containing protein [Daldinia caldariorum]|uniref:peptidase family M48-domain-containing protein n=1 Tax=Daldinia caldariorum TaxID=326644 RepID=UPI002008669E|nr:peptidase family M48-domain-containing protein [Daldinia caldariorum]KAI1466023.1 peptidase family M48-domain-containing protein [Daldinia caldariorum]